MGEGVSGVSGVSGGHGGTGSVYLVTLFVSKKYKVLGERLGGDGKDCRAVSASLSVSGSKKE